MIEWLAIPAGIVAGAVSGWAAAWLGRPAAAAAAEEVKQRQAARRELVDMGRALLTEAYAGNWSYEMVALDSRFAGLRRHLSDEVRGRYTIHHAGLQEVMIGVMANAKVTHEALRLNIERLDREWELT